jgi:hypothetical protein
MDAQSLEALAKSVARERGLVAVKSDTNGFKLIDLATRKVISGHNFELSALDIITICHEAQQLRSGSG